MGFSNEVNWNLGDFAIAAFLLVGAGLMIEFVIRKFKSRNSRIAFSLVILLILVLNWVDENLSNIETQNLGKAKHLMEFEFIEQIILGIGDPDYVL